MAKQKKISIVPKQKNVSEDSSGALAPATGTKDFYLAHHLLNQALNALWIPADLSKEEEDDLIKSALATLGGIRPRS